MSRITLSNHEVDSIVAKRIPYVDVRGPAKAAIRAALALYRERIVEELRREADQGFDSSRGPSDGAKALADFADRLERKS